MQKNRLRTVLICYLCAAIAAFGGLCLLRYLFYISI